MKKKDWVPDDFVRISRRASGKINFPICDVLEIIEDWKSFCLARGKAMGFDLDILKLEKSVNDQFVGMALPAPGSIPISEHHTSNPMTELSIQTWQKFAGEIMRGNRAFCLAHMKDKHEAKVLQNLKNESPRWEMVTDKLGDETTFTFAAVAALIGYRSVSTISRDWFNQGLISKNDVIQLVGKTAMITGKILKNVKAEVERRARANNPQWEARGVRQHKKA